MIFPCNPYNLFNKTFLCIFLGLSEFCFAQFPTTYFQSPLETSLNLSGTFAEIRNNHLHSGIDIKTNNEEGKKVLASAEGYISRIKISATGYGKALYIRHPNGYVTVYGHLKQFNEQIETYVKNIQYQKESFEIDISLNQGEISVQKQSFIAFSGNTGGSESPHLHFEIRDAKTEEIINPLLFGIKILDNVPPILKKIAIYPLNENSGVNGNITSVIYDLEFKQGNWEITGSPEIKAYGFIGFGIEAHDQDNAGKNMNGIYHIELFSNDIKISDLLFDRFKFEETKYVNALIDYKNKMSNKGTLIQSHILPNNHISLINRLLRGVIDVKVNHQYTITYKITDGSGNLSYLKFKVTGEKKPENNSRIKPRPVSIFSYKQDNFFKTNDFEIKIPAKALYDSLAFEYTNSPAYTSFSAVHHIHNKYTPLHSSAIISIRPVHFPVKWKDKAAIALIKDNKHIYAGGSWNEKFLTAKISVFGDYIITLDTIAPLITPLNISEEKDMKNEKELKIKIKDEFSGIKNYRATIDGKWVLMEFDAKKDLLIYTFDNSIPPGNHQFLLQVADAKSNTSVVKINFRK